MKAVLKAAANQFVPVRMYRQCNYTLITVHFIPFFQFIRQPASRSFTVCTLIDAHIYSYIVSEKKTCSKYLHIHLNATPSKMGGLLRYFQLLFTPKRRMKRT